MHRWIFLIAVFVTISCSFAYADEPSLYDEILQMDSMLFEAFNNSDIQKTKEIFDPDLEFYHDKGGVTNYDQAIENTRRLFESNTGLRRELIVESMHVYPVAGYGAIQVGKHRFCHPENGIMDCGVFDFLHIWKKGDVSWTLARVVSYGH